MSKNKQWGKRRSDGQSYIKGDGPAPVSGDYDIVPAPTRNNKIFKNIRSIQTNIAQAAKENNIDKSRWIASKRIRGWGDSTSGYEVSETKDYNGFESNMLVVTHRSGQRTGSYQRDEDTLLKIKSGLEKRGIEVEPIYEDHDPIPRVEDSIKDNEKRIRTAKERVKEFANDPQEKEWAKKDLEHGEEALTKDRERLIELKKEKASNPDKKQVFLDRLKINVEAHTPRRSIEMPRTVVLTADLGALSIEGNALVRRLEDERVIQHNYLTFSEQGVRTFRRSYPKDKRYEKTYKRSDKDYTRAVTFPSNATKQEVFSAIKDANPGIAEKLSEQHLATLLGYYK